MEKRKGEILLGFAGGDLQCMKASNHQLSSITTFGDDITLLEYISDHSCLVATSHKGFFLIDLITNTSEQLLDIPTSNGLASTDFCLDQSKQRFIARVSSYDLIFYDFRKPKMGQSYSKWVTESNIKHLRLVSESKFLILCEDIIYYIDLDDERLELATIFLEDQPEGKIGCGELSKDGKVLCLVELVEDYYQLNTYVKESELFYRKVGTENTELT